MNTFLHVITERELENFILCLFVVLVKESHLIKYVLELSS